MKRSRVGLSGWSFLRAKDDKKSSRLSSRTSRRSAFEALEPRWVLSTTVGIGAPVLVAFQESAPADATFTAQSSVPGDLTATVLNASHLLEMTVHTVNADGTTGTSGVMKFLLLDDYAPNNIAHITELADSGFYDGLTFHRVIEKFMIQGGDPLGTGAGGSGPDGSHAQSFDDEFNVDIRFTSNGLLALANSGPDTNDCQFFITSGEQRFLDYGYTIVAKLVAGDDIRQAIASVETTYNSSGELSQPLDPPIIDSIRVFDNTSYGLVLLKADAAADPGPVTVTVTASDGSTVTMTDSDGALVSSLDVQLAYDTPTGDRSAFITSLPPVYTTMNTAVTIDIPVAEGDAGVPLVYAAGSPNASIVIATPGTNATDGKATITPSNNLVGLYSIIIGVQTDNGGGFKGNQSYDSQETALYITPTAPTAVSFATSGVTNGGSTTLHNGIKFHVTGVAAGVTVAIYADGQSTPFATGVASGSTIDITSTTQLTNGTHTFVARQIAPYGDTQVGNHTIAAGVLRSDPTASISVNVIGTAVPDFRVTTPAEGAFTTGQTVALTWWATNASGASKVSLCYDEDKIWWNGNEHWIEIDQVAGENGYHTYAWNTTGVKPGTYYLAGYLFNDGVPYFSHLLQPITIAAPAPPSFMVTTPSSGTFTVGDTITVGFRSNNVAAGAKVSLCYDVDANMWNGNHKWLEIDKVNATNGVGTWSWDTAGMKPGTYYLAGYLFNNGVPYYSHMATSITIQAPPAPTFRVTAPLSGSYVAGESVNIYWAADNVPTGSNVSLCYDKDGVWNGNEKWIEIDQVAAINGGYHSYPWDTTNVAPGTYYVGGYLWANNAPTFSYLPQQVTITAAALTLDSVAPLAAHADTLADAQLQPIVVEAQRRLAEALGIQTLASLSGVAVRITDLPGNLLGERVGNTIYIDRDAAGRGWFVDSTPGDDVEFADVLASGVLAAHQGPAAQRVDLLTTVMHEMEHVLGQGHSDPTDLMSPTLRLGERKLVDSGVLDRVLASI